MRHMPPDIEELLNAARDPREVRIVIRNLCAAFGEVAGTGVVCSAREHDATEITAFVEMKERIAMKVAQRIGTSHLGAHLVVFRYPAPPGFPLPPVAQAERRRA